ncbi:MAG: glycosyltransferase [Bacteroidetes bacterium]|nr:glycosyltransferase [Bacteroidota bacterium]
MFDWGGRTTTVDGKKVFEPYFWSHLTATIIMVIYTICSVFIFLYACVQVSLGFSYLRNMKKNKEKHKADFDEAKAPLVTLQLPMYNEIYVADRIIDTVAAFDYPKDKLQIQVLDDSTDETKDIIAKKVKEWEAKGLNISHIHRVNRTGYKAGALDSAMDQVEGEFIAIFDADFVPDPDFLKKTIPHFKHDRIGVVQTRWGHLNKDYSSLTKLQAFGLDAHFIIEQCGRNSNEHFINFNGTAGVWRKSCIEDAGGWEHDTITEDLDLSYRAQIKGWQFMYLVDVVSPAELPITMSALKNQQHRWMKGGAEVFLKIWKRLVFAKGVRMSDKFHGMAHLFNSSIFLFIMILSITSLFMSNIVGSFPDLEGFIKFYFFFYTSTFLLMLYYWIAYRNKTGNRFKDLLGFVLQFFLFLTISSALALSNAVAVLEGWLGIKSSFVRTPKFNVNRKSEFSGNKYDKKQLSLVNFLEIAFFLIFSISTYFMILEINIGTAIFHGMLAAGYAVVIFHTFRELRTQQ